MSYRRTSFPASTIAPQTNIRESQLVQRLVVITLLILIRRQYILTKGDNNVNNDAVLYPNGEGFASREHVIGVVRGTVPFLGWPFIKLNELLSRPTRYKL